MPLLEVEDVTVTFGGVRALNAVSLEVDSGQLVGLIGPNGAGKSTMLGVLSGLQSCNQGNVKFEGKDITKAPPYRRSAMGMARSFQRLELWGSMTVRENVATAAELASKRLSGRGSVRSVTDAMIDRFGLGPVAETRASELPTGIARLTEVARAMASLPTIVLLDEPSAGLDDGESQKLTDALMSIVSEDTSILLVEHHIEMVMRACSHIYVLDFGTLIASGPPSEIRSSDVVQTAYLGTSYANRN